MSKIKSPSDRKPPLAESPNRLRPRRILSSHTRSSIQTPPASLTKTQVPKNLWDLEVSQIQPEYQSISCELRALARMVEHEFGIRDPGCTAFDTTIGSSPSSIFRRGRFYDEYSARRNERLKRKKCGGTGEDRRTVCNLGVTVESGKRMDSKKFESLRKSVPANFSIGRTQNARYSLRSSKENKKPTTSINSASSVVDGDQKIGARRAPRS